MTFVSPLFLYGLFALAIPVLIHLFNFRRYKKVWFTNVRHLAEIKQETRKRSQIKQWILLALRMLAIASLVIAFAQPYIPSPLQTRKQTKQEGVSVYVDNSFSMDAVGKEGKLFDIARSKAKEVVAAFKPSDRFQLITNDFEGRHQHFITREEFERFLDEVTISPVSRPVSEVISRQQDLLKELPNLNKNIFLISDFQQSTSDFANATPDTSISFFLLQLTANSRNNLFIDSAWFESPVQQPDQVSRLRIRIRNSGSDWLEKIPVKLTLNHKQKAIASAEVEAESETELVLPFTNDPGGIQSGFVEITDYPVVYDDKCFLSYPLVSSVSILCINDGKENPYLNALYGTDSAFRFTNASVNRLQYARFNEYELIILNQLKEIPSGLAQELKRFVSNDGHLVIIPAENPDLASYKTFTQPVGLPDLDQLDTFRLRVSGISLESQVYNDVFELTASGRVELPENADLPLVLRHFTLQQKSASRLEPLLRLQNGDLYLATVPFEKGRIYLLTSPLDRTFTNFPTHLLFVPTFYKIALLSQPFSRLYYYTGSNTPIEVRTDSLKDQIIYRISDKETGFEMIPEIRQTGARILLFPHEQIREAGLYTLTRNEIPVTVLAYNFSRLESDLRVADLASILDILTRKNLKTCTFLKEQSPSVVREISDLRKGTPLWKLFLLLALLFLAAEIAVIRLMKKK
ncbi:MAG: BatA and WFA domain-containing protein [bacterium]